MTGYKCRIRPVFTTLGIVMSPLELIKHGSRVADILRQRIHQRPHSRLRHLF